MKMVGNLSMRLTCRFARYLIDQTIWPHPLLTQSTSLCMSRVPTRATIQPLRQDSCNGCSTTVCITFIHRALLSPFHLLQAATKPALAVPLPVPSPSHAPSKPEPDAPPTIPIGTILTLPCAHMNGKAHFPSRSTRSAHSGTPNTSLNMTADLQALELSISRRTFGQVPSRRSQEFSPADAGRSAGIGFPDSTRAQISERRRSMSSFGKSLQRSAIPGGKALAERV